MCLEQSREAAALYRAYEVMQQTPRRAIAVEHLTSLVSTARFEAHQSPLGDLCPVALARSRQLVHCRTLRSATTFRDCCALYRGKFYWLSSAEALCTFTTTPDPEQYASVPVPAALPKRRGSLDVRSLFPKQLELRGYCPVALTLGDCTYESVVAGDRDCIVEYNERLWCLADLDACERFMLEPHRYVTATLPARLPPPKQPPVPLSELPILDYVEKTCATGSLRHSVPWRICAPNFPSSVRATRRCALSRSI